MPTRRDKVTAHAEHVLDVYLRVRSTYAMLDPLLFNKEVVQRWNKGHGARGRQILQNSLFYSCVLDVAKLTFDQDRRTPSIIQLVAALDDKELLRELREGFAIWSDGVLGEHDPEILKLLEASERAEEEGRRGQFDTLVEELKRKWEELETSNTLKAFITVRDKFIAHHELWHDGGQYRALDIAKLDIKFGDVKAMIREVQSLVDLITLIFRNTSFAFDILDASLQETSVAFWNAPVMANTR